MLQYIRYGFFTFRYRGFHAPTATSSMLASLMGRAMGVSYAIDFDA